MERPQLNLSHGSTIAMSAEGATLSRPKGPFGEVMPSALGALVAVARSFDQDELTRFGKFIGLQAIEVHSSRMTCCVPLGFEFAGREVFVDEYFYCFPKNVVNP